MNRQKITDAEKKICEVVKKEVTSLITPFYWFLFEPEFEPAYNHEFVKLSKRLQTNGIETEVIWLNQWLIDALMSIDTIDNLAEYERIDRRTLKMDLTSINSGLPKLIAERMIRVLKNKPQNYCVIILRIGSLIPLVDIPSFVTMLEGKVKCMMVILHPEKDYKMFNYTDKQSPLYYRGEIL